MVRMMLAPFSFLPSIGGVCCIEVYPYNTSPPVQNQGASVTIASQDEALRAALHFH
jgi:hypothetical protein